jgi:hypothetical protein
LPRSEGLRWKTIAKTVKIPKKSLNGNAPPRTNIETANAITRETATAGQFIVGTPDMRRG